MAAAEGVTLGKLQTNVCHAADSIECKVAKAEVAVGPKGTDGRTHELRSAQHAKESESESRMEEQGVLRSKLPAEKKQSGEQVVSGKW